MVEMTQDKQIFISPELIKKVGTEPTKAEEQSESEKLKAVLFLRQSRKIQRISQTVEGSVMEWA